MSDQTSDHASDAQGTPAESGVIDTTGAVQGTVDTPTPFARFTEYALNRSRVEGAQVSDRLNADQMNLILTAQTEEELDAAMSIESQTTALKDIPNGTVITIYGYQLAEGKREDFKNRIGAYAVMDATIGRDPAHIVLETGIERVIGWLRMAEVQGLFPARRLVVTRAAGSGEMVTLRKIDD